MTDGEPEAGGDEGLTQSQAVPSFNEVLTSGHWGRLAGFRFQRPTSQGTLAVPACLSFLAPHNTLTAEVVQRGSASQCLAEASTQAAGAAPVTLLPELVASALRLWLRLLWPQCLSFPTGQSLGAQVHFQSLQ